MIVLIVHKCYLAVCLYTTCIQSCFIGNCSCGLFNILSTVYTPLGGVNKRNVVCLLAAYPLPSSCRKFSLHNNQLPNKGKQIGPFICWWQDADTTTRENVIFHCLIFRSLDLCPPGLPAPIEQIRHKDLSAPGPLKSIRHHYFLQGFMSRKD